MADFRQFMLGGLFGSLLTMLVMSLSKFSHELKLQPEVVVDPSPYVPGQQMDTLEVVGSVADLKLFYSEMRNARTYLEYGAGGSTTLAALTVSDMVYSIEPYVLWCEKLQQNSLVKHRMAAGRMEMACPKAPYEMGNWGYKIRDSTSKRVPISSEPASGEFFVTAPETTGLKGGTVDLVLVDSRYRVACALYASRYMTADSRLIIHDFWMREAAYSKVFEYFDVVIAPGTLGNKARVQRRFPQVQFAEPMPFIKSLILPVLGEKSANLTSRLRLGAQFAVFKLNSKVLDSRVPGEPLPEYLNFLEDQR